MNENSEASVAYRSPADHARATQTRPSTSLAEARKRSEELELPFYLIRLPAQEVAEDAFTPTLAEAAEGYGVEIQPITDQTTGFHSYIVWTTANDKNLHEATMGIVEDATVDSNNAVVMRYPGMFGDTPPPANVRALDTQFRLRTPLWKRAMDVTVSAAVLLCCLPLFVVIGIAIKLTSKGPILFRQRRTGVAGVPFSMWKFRTMVDGAEKSQEDLMALNERDGPAFKMTNDPRVTSLGDWLRRSCVDELPQMWNVLVGDMSLVGPRPLPVAEAEQCAIWQRRRHDVAPGLTCYWQLSDRAKVSFDEWVRMDLAYIKDRSLRVDLKIIWQTIRFVINSVVG